ncbi:protein PAL OF QUIRKY-like [Gastrolobium bilobum]|uniref:protein PAL OF QUIRKY-like n=1 Tax=Gastrolobium bilobum TaxID=150636 RepID=UPI002AB22831|nr:protein PAL OF QUIRKY-like [Gastrolobium bilobum]
MESKPTLCNSTTVKFLCSYGGKILPRLTDGKLRYSGGHTRVLALHPSISFSELMVKLGELCGSSVTLRCPLPNGDLETLISITSDEDLANIIEEYDRASSSLAHPLKIRVILSPIKSLKKLSPSPSSSSSATHSPSGSSHASVESPPYSMAHRFIRQNCSPAPVGYPIGVPNGAVKGCWYTEHFNGSPRFLNGGAHCNNYCH